MDEYKDDPMSDEFIHLRFELNRKIEYMKNRMLKFLYYSSLLQAAIIAYFQFVKDSSSVQIFIYILILISGLIAIATMYFLMKYHKDYQYYLYRSEIYIDPKFSVDAKKCLDVPFSPERKFPDEIIDIDEIIEKYFKSYNGQLFQFLYNLFNFGISFLVILYLIDSFDIEPSLLKMKFTIPIVLFCISILSLSFGIYFSDSSKIKIKQRLRKHKRYVEELDKKIRSNQEE